MGVFNVWQKKPSLFYATCISLVQFIAAGVCADLRCSCGAGHRGGQRGVDRVVHRAGHREGHRKGHRAGYRGSKRAPPSPAALGGLTGSVSVHRHCGPVPWAVVVLLTVTRRSIRKLLLSTFTHKGYIHPCKYIFSMISIKLLYQYITEKFTNLEHIKVQQMRNGHRGSFTILWHASKS